MRHGRRLKAVLAGLVVTLSLVMPATLILGAPATRPTLYFDGLRVKMCDDGSVQLLMDIAVEAVSHWSGISYELYYDKTLLAPSDFDDNTALSTEITRDFFRLDPELYDPALPSPIDETKKSGFTPGAGDMGLLYMDIVLLRSSKEDDPGEWLDLTGSKLEVYEPVGDTVEGDDVFYVLNTTNTPNSTEPGAGEHEGGAAHGKTVIGTISFRADAEDIPAIVALYGGVVEKLDPVGTDGSYLIDFDRDGAGVTKILAWLIHYCESTGDLTGNVRSYNRLNGDALFTLKIAEEEVIAVEPLEKAVAVNAYQAYSDGTQADIPRTLQKFGPMVTVTYADGSRENKIMPWGSAATEAGYEARLYDGTPIVAYDPTGVIDDSDPSKPNYDYKISQHYTWQVPDGAGGTTTRKFPVPVEVTLEVQEIHLLGFASEHLVRTYPINAFLPTLTAGSTGLELPDFARVMTDIPPGNNSMLMPIPGWRSANAASPSKWPNAASMNDLYADISTTGDVHWPDSDDLSGTIVPANHVGTYSFEMAAGNGGFATPFKKTDVEREFPWLTTPTEPNAVYNMPDASRILDEAGVVSDVIDYRATYVSTVESTNQSPILTLRVARTGSNDMAVNAAFRILMPDGTEIITSGLGSWFDTTVNASYDHTRSAPPNAYYDLSFDTGQTDLGGFKDEREALRRHINLGGYFYIAVNEDTAAKQWSDFIPVYVPPRANRHLDDAEYNFLGVNARLFHYPGVLTKTITVPQGVYHPVNENGLPLYALVGGGATTDPKALGASGLYAERFGVETTYDGLTGAEPGRLYTFEVDGTGAWGPSPVSYPGGTYDQYGADTFVNGRVYGAYGRVVNLDAHTATMRLETPRDTAVPDEKIKVTYLGASASINMDAGGHLLLAKYDNRTVGYTDRQDYEFVILNEGDTDLYDLAILNDSVEAAFPDGHFIVTRPPAAFLPAGGTTTFTLTYVYDLPANGTTVPEYRDHLYVTSSARPPEELNTADPNTYLATFDASFSVTTAKQHRIIFDITPTAGTMGDAGVIVGEETNDPDNPSFWTMNYDPGSNRAEKAATTKHNVYFTVTLNDPLYEIAEVTVIDATGYEFEPPSYTGGTGDDGDAILDPDKGVVYSFAMPDYDVTIRIVFKESLKSKLRLYDGWIWASPDNVGVETAGTNMQQYPLYQKEFTPPEDPATGNQYLLMMSGRATDAGIHPLNYHYLSVIPNEAQYIQVEILLRQVLAIVAGNAPLTGIAVSMTLYDSDGVQSTGSFGYPPDGVFYQGLGQTNPPTLPPADGYDHHLSQVVIPGPAEDKSIYVVVTLTGSESTGASETYEYFFEIHRAPKAPVVTYRYGNAPYGLIMNAAGTDIAAADQPAAKAAFVANKYSFDGLAANLVPDAAGAVSSVHYWSEAWVKPGKLYEPETGTGMTTLGPPPGYDPTVYNPADNLDLDDYVLFVQVGEPFDEPGLLTLFDSSGRAIDLDADEELVSCTAEVTLLDGTAPDLVGRYSMPDPADPVNAAVVARRTALLDMGGQAKAGTTNWWSTNARVQKLDGAGDPEVDADGKKVYEPLTGTFLLRPGVYTLIYTYTDFDGVNTLSVTRTLVVLSPVGDVNGSRVTDGADRTDLRKRVGTPLGYDESVTYYPHTNLYKFRVCDVNNDRNINNIDANQLNSSPRNAYYIFTGYRPV